MAFTPYATASEFKTWVVLNDAIDDTVISDIVNSVSRWIDEYTGRYFWRDGTPGNEVARTFVACNSWRIDIDDLVPGSVTAVKTDETGDGTFETTWAATDYQLFPVNQPAGQPHVRIEAIGGLNFPMSSCPGRRDRVQITGIWGWTAVPTTVKQACLIQAGRVLKRRHSPEGISGFGDFAIRVSNRLDPDVELLLAPYKRYAVLVA